MNIHEPNLADSFKKWKRELEIYMIATEKTKKANATQVAIILNCAGPDFISIYDHFQWSSEGDKERPDKLLEKLEEYCAPKGNVVVNAYRFWNARWKEPFDAYLTELRTMAALCEYDDVDRMIRDKIVFSASGKLQELLLRDTNLTLGTAIDICRAFEMTHRQVKEMNPDSMIEKVNVSKTKREYRKEKPRYESNAAHENNATKECDYCGYKHWPGRDNCAAWGKQCSFCKAPNHFSAKCRKKRHAVRSVDHQNADSDTEWLHTYGTAGDTVKKRITALMQVNDCDVRFLLDTGADVNTITQRFVHKQQVRQSSGKLIMWNGSKVSPVGATTLIVTNPKTHEKHEVEFVVVQNDLTCLIGSTTVQEIGLITVHADQFVAEVKGSPQNKRTNERKTDDESRTSTQKTAGWQGKCAPTKVGVRGAPTCHAASKHEVDDLGSMVTATRTTDHNVRARVLPSRKRQISVQKPVKQELDTLVRRRSRGVLIYPSMSQHIGSVRWQSCTNRMANCGCA